MQGSSIKEAESSILELQNSLQTTSKNIQLSKELIQQLQESYHSVKQHQQHRTTSLKMKNVESFHLNRSITISNSQHQYTEIKPNMNSLQIHKDNFVKQRQFGKIKKSRRLQILESYQKEHKQNNQEIIENINNEKKILRNFSFLSNEDVIQNEEQIFKVSISKYELCKTKRKGQQQQQQKESDFFNQQQQKKGKLNKIRYQFDNDNDDNKKNNVCKTERVQGQETNRYYKFRFHTDNTNHIMNDETPVRKLIQESDRFNPQTQRRQRSKNRRPIFEKKFLFQSCHEEQMQNFQSRFSNIKQKLRMTESLIESNLKKRKQRQLEQKIQSKLSKIITNTKTQANKQLSSRKHYQKICKQKLPSNKNSNSLNLKLRQKSKSYSPNKNSHHHNKSSCQKPTTIFNYFSKSNYYIPNPISCPKFKKQLQKQTRQRYLSQAFKIPGVDRCFTYSQIYQFYILFRKMQYPQYKWVQFLVQKVKTFGYPCEYNLNLISTTQ